MFLDIKENDTYRSKASPRKRGYLTSLKYHKSKIVNLLWQILFLRTYLVSSYKVAKTRLLHKHG